MLIGSRELVAGATPVIIQTKDSSAYQKIIPFLRENTLNFIPGISIRPHISGLVIPPNIGGVFAQSQFSPFHYLEMPTFNMVASIMTGPMLEEVLQSSYVKAVYRDELKTVLQYNVVPADGIFTVKTSYDTTMTFTSTYWTKSILGGFDANAKGYLGQGVNATVIDTGGTRFNLMTTRLNKYTAIPGLTTDANGHGEWCVAALGGAPSIDRTFSDIVGKPVQLEGMAPYANISEIKALDLIIGMGSDSSLIKAIEMAIAIKSDVVSMSWGGSSSSQAPTESPFYTPFQTMVDNGIIPVVAAGNSGPAPNTIDDPGDLPQGLTVGAYNAVTNAKSMFGNAGEVCGFSSRGPTNWNTIKPDTIAPGAIIDNAISGVLSGAYTHYVHAAQAIAGTSMATPIVAGLVTLMRQAYAQNLGKTLTVQEIKTMLSSLGHPQTNIDGYGPINWAMFEQWMSTQYGVTL